MSECSEKLTRILEAVFDAMRDDWRSDLSAEEYDERKADFVFHMTDWKGDLDRLAALYQNPASDADAAADSVVAFLFHVIPHLNAAGHLLLDDVGSAFPDAATKVISRETPSGACHP